MTFRDMQLEVLGWLDEQDDTDVTVERVKAALNAANRRRALERDWDFMLVNPPVYRTLTAGSRLIRLPDDCRRVTRLYNATQAWDYEEVPPQALQAHGLPATRNESSPRYFYVRGEAPRELVFFMPQAADELELHYYKAPTTMVDDEDLPDLPAAHHDLLVWDALILMKAYHSDADSYPAWLEAQRSAFEALLWNYSMGTHTVAGQPTYIRYIP